MDTPSRRLFGELFDVFEVGEAAGNEGRSVRIKTIRNYPKLSWKSMTCDASPGVPIDRNRTAGGVATAPFAANPLPQISMNNPPTALLHHHNTTCNWDGNILFFTGRARGANQVLTIISNSEVGTARRARRAVRGRLGEATLPKADLRQRTKTSSLSVSNLWLFIRLKTFLSVASCGKFKQEPTEETEKNPGHR
jgi:hypothetical protein